MIVYQAGPSARERIWRTIRAQRTEITQSGLAVASGTTLSLVRNYVQGLLKAGYLHQSGERAAAMYSLIGSARLNRINPEAYLAYVLERRLPLPYTFACPMAPGSILRNQP